MSGFYGDLIVVDIDPLRAAQEYSVAEMRSALEGLDAIAANLGLREIWSRAQFIGPDRGEGEPGLKRGMVGVSLSWACIAGVGFWREYYLTPEITDSMRSSLNDETEHKRLMAGKWLERAEAEVAQRGPEVEAIRNIAAAAKDHFPFPLKAVIDIKASWGYQFEVAYRRRLAYALGFEASIAAGSLAPYQDHLTTLITGEIEDLITACPTASSPHAFSVFLNLLATLDGALTFEKKNGKSSPDLPGPIVHGDKKRTFLAEMLQESARHRSAELRADGRLAIAALLIEVEELREVGRLYNPVPPIWGTISESQHYLKSPVQ